MNPRTASGIRVLLSTRPLSMWLCDAACLAFGLFTVCCHAVVAVGGGLRLLIVLFSVALLAASVAAWVLSRRGRQRGEPLAIAATEASESRFDGVLSRVGLGLGVVGILLYLVQGDLVVTWWWCVVLLGLAAVAFVVRAKPYWQAPREGVWLERGLWLLALLAVAVTLVSHRPDLDDSFYVNLAAAAADQPGLPLLAEDTLFGIEGLPIHLWTYRAHSIEMLNAAMSYLTGVPAIYCFHWFSAALAALLVPFAFARLMRVLKPRHWLWATLAVVVVLVAPGETHRWYGNFSFVRMWQGKSIYLSFFVPLIYAYGLSFMRRPSLWRWLLLAAAQIGAIGCTSSALWSAPLSAGLALVCGLWWSWPSLKAALLGLLASSYVLSLGLLLKGQVEEIMKLAASIRLFAFGARLEEAFKTVLGAADLRMLSVATLLIAWACCPRGLARRFAIVFPLVGMGVLLNPYLDDFIAHNLTGPAYWRSMWLMPLPILIALLLTAPLELGKSRCAHLAGGLATLLLLGAFATTVPAYGGLSKRNRVTLSWPTVKLPQLEYGWAALLSEQVPPGSFVVAPEAISVWLPTFHDRLYPMTVRRTYLMRQRDRLGVDVIVQRHVMTKFVDGLKQRRNATELFVEGLERFQVRAVCLKVNPITTHEARLALRELGFERTERGGVYEIWVRP